MKLNIMNYKNIKKDLDIQVEDVHHIDVLVLAGDEVLTVVKNNYESCRIDSADIFDEPRYSHGLDMYDGEYTVDAKHIGEWIERENAYEYLFACFDDGEEESEED